MQYRITYQPQFSQYAETIIVTGIRAVHALIDAANKWNDTIVSIEERESRTRTWKPTTISQAD